MMRHDVFIHLYTHRRYIWKNSLNELRYRYAGTGMGIFWIVVYPIVLIFLYTVIFSWIFPQRAQGGTYVLYLTSGLLAWRVFIDTIQRGSNAFIENARYLKRLTIPAEVFVARIALTSTFIVFIYYLLLLPVNLMLGNYFGWQIVLLPFFLLLLQTLAFGMSLILANLRALFPDVEHMIQALLPLWMWTLPVIYPISILPATLRPWLVLNPPYIFLRSIRSVMLEAALPGLHNWIIIGSWLLLLLWGGAFVHHKLQSEMKEVI